MKRYGLRDDQFARIETLLPGRPGTVGRSSESLFKTLADDPDNEYAMIDATIVRAHQHSAGARKKGVTTKPSAALAAGLRQKST